MNPLPSCSLKSFDYLLVDCSEERRLRRNQRDSQDPAGAHLRRCGLALARGKRQGKIEL